MRTKYLLTEPNRRVPFAQPSRTLILICAVPHRHLICCGYTPPFATIAESNMTTAPKKESAFMKALKPSAALAAVVGADPLPRTEVIKKLWEYIKAHNLQNPANKRNILCDAKLKAVLGKDEVTMFELTGLAGKHLS